MNTRIWNIWPPKSIIKEIGDYKIFKTNDGKCGLLDAEYHLVICPNYDSIEFVELTDCNLTNPSDYRFDEYRKYYATLSDTFFDDDDDDFVKLHVWIDDISNKSNYILCKNNSDFDIVDLSPNKIDRNFFNFLCFEKTLYKITHIIYNIYLCEDLSGVLSLCAYEKGKGFQTYKEIWIQGNFKIYEGGYISFSCYDKDGFDCKYLYRVTKEENNISVQQVSSFPNQYEIVETWSVGDFIVNTGDEAYIIRITPNDDGIYEITAITSLYAEISRGFICYEGSRKNVYDFSDNGKYGLLDFNYNVLLGPVSDYSLSYCMYLKKLIILENNKKKGVLDENCKIVVPAEYDFIQIHNTKGLFSCQQRVPTQYDDNNYQIDDTEFVREGSDHGIIFAYKKCPELINTRLYYCVIYSSTGEEQLSFITDEDFKFYYDPEENYVIIYGMNRREFSPFYPFNPLVSCIFVNDRKDEVSTNSIIFEKNEINCFEKVVKSPLCEQILYIGNKTILCYADGKISLFSNKQEETKTLHEFSGADYSFTTIAFNGILVGFKIQEHCVYCDIFSTTDFAKKEQILIEVCNKPMSRDVILSKLGEQNDEMGLWIKGLFSIYNKPITFPEISQSDVDVVDYPYPDEPYSIEDSIMDAFDGEPDA